MVRHGFGLKRGRGWRPSSQRHVVDLGEGVFRDEANSRRGVREGGVGAGGREREREGWNVARVCTRNRREPWNISEW